jgi:hypothetical protein
MHRAPWHAIGLFLVLVVGASVSAMAASNPPLNADQAASALASRAQRAFPRRECTFSTLYANNDAKHNYLLVDDRADLARARRIAHDISPTLNSAGLNPPRFHFAVMSRMIQRLAKTKPADEPSSMGTARRPLSSTKHCPPWEIILVEGTPNYDAGHSWALTQQRRYGSDRIQVDVLPPGSPLPDAAG